jgi:hypothetical protein
MVLVIMIVGVLISLAGSTVFDSVGISESEGVAKQDGNRISIRRIQTTMEAL